MFAPLPRTRLVQLLFGSARELCSYLLIVSLCSAAVSSGSASAESDSPIDFNREIKPLLSDRCFQCHGPDAGAREADLRLDSPAEFVDTVASSGAHIVEPGEAEKSELYQRIIAEDPDERMPPQEAKLPLTAEEIERLRRWIEEGATWQSHWAFARAVRRPLPQVQASAWPRTPIDYFVLARLEREGWSPSPEAGQEALLRRLTFDLTGLPPTPAELDDFLGDAAPGAYERAVDRLLASERFGERMATPWLDLARYSDTFGYQVDRDRLVWPWREWVVQAFNENLPYDEFVTQQIAGDLLTDASHDQILATTFNRLHPQKVEGGSTEEEFRTEYVADRVHTFGTAFLGLTLECCRCHDHKYDPVSQQEYYQLFAFFNNIDEFGLYSWFTSSTPTPTLLLSDEATQQSIDQVETEIAAAERQLVELADSRKEAFHRWLEERDGATTAVDLTGLLASFPMDSFEEGKLANAVNAEQPASSSEANQLVPGKQGQAIRLTGDDAVSTSVGNFSRNQPFSVALWINSPDVKQRAVIYRRSQAWTDAGSRGYQLLLEDGKLSASLVHFWPGNAIRVRCVETVPTDTWVHVTVTYDGSSTADGLRIHVDGELAETEVIRDQLTKNITGGGSDHIAIGERFRDRGFSNGLVDEFQVYDRELTPLEISQLYDGESLVRLLARPSESWSEAEQSALFTYYLAVHDGEYAEQRQALREIRDRRSKLIDGVAEIMVMRELDWRRPTFVLRRGAYDAPTTPVDPNTPAALPPLPDHTPRNRLGLARWLTDVDHPLTARVAVNRFWQMFFGVGLVRTTEDFGSQGELPSHPELLDWMAKDFADHGWDTKRLLKQIVMSATYRQDASISADAARRDPENRLLARGPRYRLPAEMLRDNALAVSGLLVERLGGPSVRPYEVAKSFKPVNRDSGSGLYRRSLYTYWKRTGPAPVMMTLDAAKRDICTVKRERTSTPLQSLVLLNGPQFVEAARALAQRTLRQYPGDRDQMLETMFRLLTSRIPTKQELEVVVRLYDEQLDYFASQPELAKQFLENGDLPADTRLPDVQVAAAAMCAQALMNHDACIVKQ